MKKQPEHRLDNQGRRIYRMEVRIDSERRPGAPGPVPAAIANRSEETAGTREAGTDGGADAAGEEEPGAVRATYRLISAVQAWPQMGWLGPQLVDYGYDDAAAIRKIPDLVNNRKRPLPLMWNHSWDMRDKAGRVENARWEDSTDIPPGVNGDLVVNPEFDRRAAVGIATGELDVTSSSVHCDLTPSHPEMEWEDFVRLQGREVDGEIVRWLPVDTWDVFHHAMVPAGADPDSGPREEGETEQTAGRAVENSITPGGGEGDVTMKKAPAILADLAGKLGIEVSLAEGSPLPGDLEQRLGEKVELLTASLRKLNDRTAKLQALAPKLLKEGETSLTSAQVLERLPEAVDLAAHGRAFVEDLRNEALKCFDAAKVDPEKKELSAEAKAIRDVIAGCADIAQLKAFRAEYRSRAEARFGPVDLRSSKGEDLPAEKAEVSAVERDVADGATRVFGGKKEVA
jgi:hypothetical protein